MATMLTAGHAENALPQRAEAVLNCRVFPGVTVDSVQATLACIVADPAMKLEIMGHPEDSPVSEPRADLMAAIARAVHAAHPGVPIALYQEVGATGALVYRRAGIPTWGSAGFFMKRSDVFFHGRNERLPVAGFYEVVDHVHSLATELGSS